MLVYSVLSVSVQWGDEVMRRNARESSGWQPEMRPGWPRAPED